MLAMAHRYRALLQDRVLHFLQLAPFVKLQTGTGDHLAGERGLASMRLKNSTLKPAGRTTACHLRSGEALHSLFYVPGARKRVAISASSYCQARRLGHSSDSNLRQATRLTPTPHGAHTHCPAGLAARPEQCGPKRPNYIADVHRSSCALPGLLAYRQTQISELSSDSQCLDGTLPCVRARSCCQQRR